MVVACGGAGLNAMHQPDRTKTSSQAVGVFTAYILPVKTGDKLSDPKDREQITCIQTERLLQLWEYYS